MDLFERPWGRNRFDGETRTVPGVPTCYQVAKLMHKLIIADNGQQFALAA